MYTGIQSFPILNFLNYQFNLTFFCMLKEQTIKVNKVPSTYEHDVSISSVTLFPVKIQYGTELNTLLTNEYFKCTENNMGAATARYRVNFDRQRLNNCRILVREKRLQPSDHCLNVQKDRLVRRWFAMSVKLHQIPSCIKKNDPYKLQCDFWSSTVNLTFEKGNWGCLWSTEHLCLIFFKSHNKWHSYTPG